MSPLKSKQTDAKVSSGLLCENQISSRLLLNQITDKWSILILPLLCKEPLHFNEIKRNMDGITQKSLTQCLRRLEATASSVVGLSRPLRSALSTALLLSAERLKCPFRCYITGLLNTARLLQMLRLNMTARTWRNFSR